MNWSLILCGSLLLFTPSAAAGASVPACPGMPSPDPVCQKMLAFCRNSEIGFLKCLQTEFQSPVDADFSWETPMYPHFSIRANTHVGESSQSGEIGILSKTLGRSVYLNYKDVSTNPDEVMVFTSEDSILLPDVRYASPFMEVTMAPCYEKRPFSMPRELSGKMVSCIVIYFKEDSHFLVAFISGNGMDLQHAIFQEKPKDSGPLFQETSKDCSPIFQETDARCIELKQQLLDPNISVLVFFRLLRKQD